jgi:hypothetical protein
MIQPPRFYTFNILPTDFESRVPLRKENTMIGNYAEGEGISVRTSVMLFTAGWLLLALVTLPLPSAFF